MRALVTGFEPFGGDSINASIEAVRRLPARIGAIEIHTAELPTSFARSLPALEGAIERVRPAIVLCVGQASERQALCVERVAINVQDATWLAAAMLLLWAGLAALNAAHAFIQRRGVRFPLGP